MLGPVPNPIVATSAAPSINSGLDWPNSLPLATSVVIPARLVWHTIHIGSHSMRHCFLLRHLSICPRLLLRFISSSTCHLACCKPNASSTLNCSPVQLVSRIVHLASSHSIGLIGRLSLRASSR